MSIETLPGRFRRQVIALLLLGLAWTASTAIAEQKQAKRVEVGDQVPTISLEASDTNQYDFKELKGEKNLLLIFFRGTW